MTRQPPTLPPTRPADTRLEPPSGRAPARIPTRTPARIPAWAGTALRLAVPAALIALIFRTVDHGATPDALRAADSASLFLGVLILSRQIVVSAIRWRFTEGQLRMRGDERRGGKGWAVCVKLW